jgi:TonB family protein
VSVRARPGTGAIVGSVLLHGALVAVIAMNAMKGSEPLPEYKVYKVDLYSPPPQALGEPEAPKKAEPAIIKPPEPKAVSVAPSKPATTVKTPKKNVISGEGKAAVAKGRNPDPKSQVGGEGLDVHMSGDEFPYPAYLNNIIIQLTRYFRWTGADNLEVKIGFEIKRDGSVKSIRVLKKSGNINFDLEAISAVENAGKRGAFGALPTGWVAPTLPIAYSFLPPGR